MTGELEGALQYFVLRGLLHGRAQLGSYSVSPWYSHRKAQVASRCITLIVATMDQSILPRTY
jgi:hypothetical protein